jgi:nitrate reductase cytochrome c-type subunit
MKLRDLSFIAIVVLVTGATQMLSRVNKPSAMPEDLAHRTIGKDVRGNCSPCHELEIMLVSNGKHFAKWRDSRFDCTVCHTPLKTQGRAGDEGK